MAQAGLVPGSRHGLAAGKLWGKGHGLRVRVSRLSFVGLKFLAEFQFSFGSFGASCRLKFVTKGLRNILVGQCSGSTH